MVKSGQQLALLELLHSSELFSHLNNKALEPILRQAHRIRCEKNRFIKIYCDESQYCHIIEQGEIMLSRVTNDGDSYVIDVIDRGCIFGITTILEDSLYSQVLATTIKPTIIWRISLNIIRNLMKQEDDFTENLLHLELHTRLLQDLEIEHRTILNAPQRIACFLLVHCPAVNQSPVTVSIPYNKKLIAAKLGIRQETFSRALQIIKHATGTEVIGSKLKIKDINKLKSYVCHNCSLQYPCQHNHDGARIY